MSPFSGPRHRYLQGKRLFASSTRCLSPAEVSRSGSQFGDTIWFGQARK